MLVKSNMGEVGTTTEIFLFIMKCFKRFLKDNNFFSPGCLVIKNNNYYKAIKENIESCSHKSIIANSLNTIFIQTFWQVLRTITGNNYDASILYMNFLNTQGRKIAEKLCKIPFFETFLIIDTSIRDELSYIYELNELYIEIPLKDCTFILDMINYCENCKYAYLTKEIHTLKRIIKDKLSKEVIQVTDLEKIKTYG